MEMFATFVLMSIKDKCWEFGPMDMIVRVYEDTYSLIFITDLEMLFHTVAILF